jgi:Bacterial PH domain
MRSIENAVLIFPSKIDRWLLALVAVPLAISLGATVSALLAHPPLEAILLIVGIEVLLFGFIAWTFRSTRYEMTGREVIARSGPFRWRIEIAAIESIRPSRNPLSSPALSLDRMEIRYANGRRLLVSPEDRIGFLEAIVARSSGLRRIGEELRRA